MNWKTIRFKVCSSYLFCLLRSQVWLQIAAYLSLKWSSKGVSAVLLLHNCHQQQPLQAMSADHCWDYLPTNDLLVSLSLCYRFCLSALCAFFSCLSCCNCLLTAHTCQRLVKLQLRCLALSSIVNGNVCSGCCWFQKQPTLHLASQMAMKSWWDLKFLIWWLCLIQTSMKRRETNSN